MSIQCLRFWWDLELQSSSNTSRIPDKISYNGVYRNNPDGKANLFNDYFCSQFSQSSSYNIPIDYLHDDHFKDFKIDFRKVRNILKSLNANKSFGPVNI